MMATDVWASYVERFALPMVESERAVFALSTWLCTTGVALVLNALLYGVHVTGWFHRFKIQSAKWPSRQLVMQCLQRTVLVDMVLVRAVVLWFAAPFLMGRLSGFGRGDALPAWHTMALHIVVCMVINNALFYWAHRALHDRRIYKYIHKHHHQFKATVGIAAEHAHPLEQLLANTVPTMGGALLLRTHWLTFFVWLAIREAETVDAHCGYEFPWSPFNWLPFQGGADRHDYHHSHWNNGNYGGAFFCFWDWLCGTDKDYKLWKQQQQQQQQAKKQG